MGRRQPNLFGPLRFVYTATRTFPPTELCSMVGTQPWSNQTGSPKPAVYAGLSLRGRAAPSETDMLDGRSDELERILIARVADLMGSSPQNLLVFSALPTSLYYSIQLTIAQTRSTDPKTDLGRRLISFNDRLYLREEIVYLTTRRVAILTGINGTIYLIRCLEATMAKDETVQVSL